MASSFPPGARDACEDFKIRTVVAKVCGSKNAGEWASIQTGVGQLAQAVALVRLDVDEGTPMVYIVLTYAKPDLLANIVPRLKKKLKASPIEAEVEWIRALDRRLTLLFGWGDVWATVEQIDKAVSNDDKSELERCFPMLSNVIANGKFLPAVVAEGLSKQGLLCIADAPRADRKEQADRLYIQHELEGHMFGEPGKNWECSLCNRFLASRCVCLERRGARNTWGDQLRRTR